MSYRSVRLHSWIVVFLLFVIPPTAAAAPSSMLMTVESPYGIEKTIANIKQSLVNNNFRLLREQNVDDGVTESVDPNFRILYFCNFALAYKAIQNEKRIGFMLPCRLTVTKVNNKVFIHYLNPAFAKQMVGGHLDDLCDQISLAFSNIIEEVTM